MIRKWIEAMRLRTLPVSVAGVIAGTGCAIMLDSFKAAPALAALHGSFVKSIRRLVFLLLPLAECLHSLVTHKVFAVYRAAVVVES